MRLYLCSSRPRGPLEALLALLGSGRRALVIDNGLDMLSPADRDTYFSSVHDPVAEFARLGISARRITLGRAGQDETALEGCDLVWAMGGSAFLLRRAMRRSGFERALCAALAEDRLVYGGFGAGTVVAGATLRGIELMDDPYRVPEGHDAEIVWDGLGLLDFAIVPHIQPQAAPGAPGWTATRANAAAAHMARIGLAFRTLRDGEALVRDRAGLRLLAGTEPAGRGLAGKGLAET